MISSRAILIEEVLRDLYSLRRKTNSENLYAIDEIINFFMAAKSRSKYLLWLLKKAPKLDNKKILELGDLSFPRWDREMHSRLIEIERKSFPGLIRPLVDRIVGFILKHNDKDLILANLGCGGMEVERQVIKNLGLRHRGMVLFVGVDKSQAAHDIAKDNLKEVETITDIKEIEEADHSLVKSITKGQSKKYTVLLCKNNIFLLSEHFRNNAFDLIYHSLFKHHFTEEDKKRVDATTEALTKNSLEYDGYRSWPAMIPQSIMVWRYPILLSATIFSDLRYLTKPEIKEKYSGKQISFYKIGTYLLQNS